MNLIKIGSIILLLLFLSTEIHAGVKIPVLMYHHIRGGEGYSRVSKDLSCGVFKNHLDYIQNNGYTTITFLDILNGIKVKKPIMLTFDDGTISQWDAFREIKSRNMKGVFFVVCGYIGDKGFLNILQIRNIANSGMEVGSHSITHPYLTKISWNKMRTEILDSKIILENLVHTKIVTFCYPYGIYNRNVVDVLNGSNYHFARTTDEGIKDIGVRDFKVEIVYIHNSTRDLSKVIK